MQGVPASMNAAGEVTLCAEEVLEALYDILLLRQADEHGLQTKMRGLKSGETTVRQIVYEMVASDEFARNVSPFLASVSKAAGSKFTNDVCEDGEIWQLIRLWVNAQADSGYVVDVGARGRERSNSYDLLKHFGWRGLLIEANPALLSSIENQFAGLDIQMVSCAISDFEGRAPLTLGINDDVSSLSSILCENWGKSRGKIEVEVLRLADVMTQFDVPWEFDLLSLDIEGEDYKVLNDLIGNSPYRPNWIIMEGVANQKVRQMQDPRFSREVRRCYTAKAATNSNLILGRLRSERNSWTAKCEENAFNKHM